jgi:hypothetical protein
MQVHAFASDAQCNNIIILYNKGQQSNDNVRLRKMAWPFIYLVVSGKGHKCKYRYRKRHVIIIIIRNNNYGAGLG